MKAFHHMLEPDTGGLAGVLVTGTDPSVGKTWERWLTLAHLPVQRSPLMRPRKPVESGCATGADGLLPQDAAARRQAGGA